MRVGKPSLVFKTNCEMYVDHYAALTDDITLFIRGGYMPRRGTWMFAFAVRYPARILDTPAALQNVFRACGSANAACKLKVETHASR